MKKKKKKSSAVWVGGIGKYIYQAGAKIFRNFAIFHFSNFSRVLVSGSPPHAALCAHPGASVILRLAR